MDERILARSFLRTKWVMVGSVVGNSWSTCRQTVRAPGRSGDSREASGARKRRQSLGGPGTATRRVTSYCASFVWFQLATCTVGLLTESFAYENLEATRI